MVSYPVKAKAEITSEIFAPVIVEYTLTDKYSYIVFCYKLKSPLVVKEYEGWANAEEYLRNMLWDMANDGDFHFMPNEHQTVNITIEEIK